MSIAMPAAEESRVRIEPPTLDRTGFMLNRLRVLSFELPGLEEADSVRSETATKISKTEAEREQHASYFDSDLADFRLDTEIVERTAAAELDRLEVDLARLEKRNPVLESLLSEHNLEKMTELRGEEEWRKFQREIDRDHLLADHEWEQLGVLGHGIPRSIHAVTPPALGPRAGRAVAVTAARPPAVGAARGWRRRRGSRSRASR